MKLWHELSFEAKSIQLVDTDLKVAVSGNTVSGGHIHIISNEEGNISDIGKSFEGGKVFDIEVYSTLCAVSHFETGENSGDIKLLRLDEPAASFSEHHVLKNCKQPNTIYNGLSFCTESFNLAASTESGSVKIWDLQTCDSVASFDSDILGVRKVDYITGNILSTVGCSSSGQLQIWDLRQRRSAIQLIEATSTKYAHPRSGGTKFVSYTCSCSFGSNVVCGTSDGQLVQWDMRNPVEPIREAKIHDDFVTAVKFFPYDDNSSVISTSRASTVKKTFLMEPFELRPEDCLLENSEEAMVALAVSDSSIFAVSSAGGIWCLQSFD